MGQFAASSGTLKPKWNQVMGQADYQLSKRTDLYLEGVYQHVSGGRGNPAFDAGVFNLTPASGRQQVVVAAGMRHRFYVGMVLGEIFEAGTFVVVPEQVYIVKKQQKHGVDWIVSDATGNLFFRMQGPPNICAFA